MHFLSLYFFFLFPVHVFVSLIWLSGKQLKFVARFGSEYLTVLPACRFWGVQCFLVVQLRECSCERHLRATFCNSTWNIFVAVTFIAFFLFPELVFCQCLLILPNRQIIVITIWRKTSFKPLAAKKKQLTSSLKMQERARTKAAPLHSLNDEVEFSCVPADVLPVI